MLKNKEIKNIMKLNKYELSMLVIFTSCIVGLIYGFMINDLNIYNITEDFKNLIKEL